MQFLRGECCKILPVKPAIFLVFPEFAELLFRNHDRKLLHAKCTELICARFLLRLIQTLVKAFRIKSLLGFRHRTLNLSLKLSFILHIFIRYRQHGCKHIKSKLLKHGCLHARKLCQVIDTHRTKVRKVFR